MGRLGFAAVLLAMLMGQGGCVSSGPDPDLRAQALPLAPQSSERFQCGPSTLASVLAFHGRPVPEKTIADAIYSPTAQGVLLHDMAWYARDQGFEAEVRKGTLEDLDRAVRERQPPIVLLDLGLAGMRRPHFTAITGVTEAGVFQLGTRRADDYVRMELFTRQWERAGNQFLVIRPDASPSP